MKSFNALAEAIRRTVFNNGHSLGKWLRSVITIRNCSADFIALTACCVVVAHVHGTRIASNWSTLQWEDPLFFSHVDDHLHSAVNLLVEPSFWKGLYRPLSTNVVYYIEVTRFHRNPRVLHAFVLATFVLNGYLLYRVGARVASVLTGALAAMLWLSRTASCEVALYGCQLQSSLPMAFTLVAILVATKPVPLSWRDTLILSLCTLGALASKETSVVTFLIIALARASAAGFAELRWSSAKFHVLPSTLVTGLWSLWSLKRLKIVNSPHWTYDFKIQSLTDGAVFHLLTIFNFALGDVQLVRPTIRESAFPHLVFSARQADGHLLFVMAVLAAVVTLFVSVPGSRIRMVAFGFIWCLLAIAPCLPLAGRWLLYYAYPGHAGLALATACLVSWVTRLARGRTAAPSGQVGAASVRRGVGSTDAQGSPF